MNMRKIIAVLASVLMLCSVIPMGALSVAAATGDVAVDWNFDDGVAHFERGTAENGYMVFDATTADWQCAYQYIGTINSDTTYKVTFKAMANKDAELTFKIQNDWAATNVAETVDVTTEWQDYELIVNSGTVNPPIVLFSSGYAAANAPIYYIDDLKIVEIVDPALIGKVVNGDFSSEEGWTLGTGATIADGVLKLENPNAWGEAAMQTVPVKANTNYEITWKSQRISGSGAFYMTTMDAAFANLQLTSGQSWMNNPATDWLDHSITLNTGASEVIILKLTAEVDNAGAILLDDITIKEMKDPSFDGYITNGDFETGKKSPWDIYSQTAVTAEAAKSGEYGLMLSGGANWGGMANQDFTVEVGKTYVVRFDACVVNQGFNVQIKDNGTNAGGGYVSKTEWTTYTYEFTPTATNANLNFCGSGTAGGDVAYLDNVMVFEKVEESYDGYIKNGTLDTGNLNNWSLIWSTQVTASGIVGGKDSLFAVQVSGLPTKLWGQFRQSVAVEPNTDYKVTVWAKNSDGMSLLVKDGADTTNLNNVSANAGEEWTQITNEFNSGDNTSVLVGVMVNSDGASGIFDSFVMEKAHVCEYVGEVTEEATCDLTGTMTYTCECGDSYTEVIPAWHDGNLTHVPAVEPTDCAHPGNIEHYTCPWCNEYFTDANASEMIAPWFINITVDCVRPEGVADCATWTCETCGTENIGAGEHDTGVPACQDGHCSKCDQDIAGYGCANYDTPACEDGVCYYCGGFVAGLGHENGASAPCLDGECSYGCGLTYPATTEHVDEDANDYCDTCWTHLNHVDADANGECDVCWNPMPEEPVEIVYGDANGDGTIDGLDEILLAQYIAEWDVELDLVAADANGDGTIDGLDEILLAQYIAEWEVTLGPVG